MRSNRSSTAGSRDDGRPDIGDAPSPSYERAPGPNVSAGPWLAVTELNHRIANEYAAAIAGISIATRKVANLEAKAALSEAAGLLRDFAQAHRVLQPPLAAGPVSVAEYLGRLCAVMTHTRLAGRNIKLALVEHDVHLDAKQCWHVGLIIAELVNNAMRHAFGREGGSIVVELGVCSDEVICCVIDDGRSSANPKPGQGALIVDALAAELGGAVERRFTERGTIVILRFPYRRRGRARSRCTAFGRLTGGEELIAVG